MPIYDFGYYYVDHAYSRLRDAWYEYMLHKGCGVSKANAVAAYKANKKIPVPV